MAGSVKDLLVKILVDDSDIEKFERAGDKALTFGNLLDKAALVSAAALAGLGAGALYAGQKASEAEQAAGAVESVFADKAASITALAEAASDAVGLSQTDYSNLASVLGAQLTNMGVANDALVPQTETLITLGADMAATFGGSTSDAVAALSSLLRGERDPIEQYGVSIKQADINAKLAAMGLTGLEGEAAKAAETQAVLALLTDQTASAQGQFARESDSAAGAQQRANAAMENASAEIGTVLLPIMAEGATALQGFAGWAKENAGLVQGLAAGIGILAGGVLVIAGAMKVWAAIQAVQTAMQWANNAAWLASPVTWIILAIIVGIGLLVAAGIWLYENWDEVTQWIGEAWQNVSDWFMAVGDGIATWWNDLWAGITGWVIDTFGPMILWVRERFELMQLGLKIVGDGIAKWWHGLWAGIGDFFSGIWNGLQDIVRGAWNGIVGWIEDGVNSAIRLINGIIRGINNVGGAIGIQLNLIPNVSIPRLATGGITMGPQLAMVGDNPGGREAILPLDSPAARDLLGGNDGPMDLSDSSIDKLARALASIMRNESRKGGEV
ncbi:phage tail tape measure protein [Microcella pacifica]|uniref:Tape measure protein n=1 Tax=Microcella pacifica TaxID=2591847 RepID=A0A9E5JNP6_9MICO|nr:hypothetical protein [Microcella pacifica]NHF62231.1 hypothetical protein [Microcella pacifica]